MADSSESFRQPPDLEVLRRLAAHWDTKTSTFVDMSAIWDSTAAMADDPPAWIFDTCALPNVAPPLQSILAFGRGVFALDAYEVTDPEFGAFMKGIGVMATPGFGSSDGESQSWKWPNFPASTKWVYCITQVIAMPDGPRRFPFKCYRLTATAGVWASVAPSSFQTKRSWSWTPTAYTWTSRSSPA